MIRMRKRLRWVLLTVVLCLLAERPMALAMASSVPNQSTTFKTVICSSHGIMVINEALGLPEQEAQKPACPWCSLVEKVGWDLPALPEAMAALLPVPVLLHMEMLATGDDQLPSNLRAAESPPRGPPSLL
jgi:hypothetical protein